MRLRYARGDGGVTWRDTQVNKKKSPEYKITGGKVDSSPVLFAGTFVQEVLITRARAHTHTPRA